MQSLAWAPPAFLEGGGQDRARGAPFGSREYVVRFRPISSGGGCCPLSADLTSGGGGGGVLSAFGRFNERGGGGGGGGGAVRFRPI